MSAIRISWGCRAFTPLDARRFSRATEPVSTERPKPFQPSDPNPFQPSDPTRLHYTYTLTVSTLSPLSTPLTRRQARHLLRRACITSDPDRVEAITGRYAADVVSEWVNAPMETVFFHAPYWMSTQYPPAGSDQSDVRAFLQQNEYWVDEVRSDWLADLMEGRLRNRMTLFWHNHFVTDIRKYRYAALAYRYLFLLTSSSLGNFRQLVRNICTDESMLYYLDGRFNRAGAPNENFARELMELFTMGVENEQGQPNYTQQDVAEAARALTGWTMNVRSSWKSVKVNRRFDPGEKTFLDATGPWDHEDIVDLIFTQRKDQVARFMAHKLLEEFHRVDPDVDVVNAVAALWKAHDFETGPVLEALLSSELFFEEDIMGARIKSPFEYVALDIALRAGHVETDKRPVVVAGIDALGQRLLSPPSVAGWPGHHAWVSTETLPARWHATGTTTEFAGSVEGWKRIMDTYTEPGYPWPAVSFALNVAEAAFAVPLEHVDVPDTGVPFAGNLDASPLPDDLMQGPAYRQHLVKLFLGSNPWYEWSPLAPQAWVMARNYFVALAQFPEYQLS